MSFGFKSLKKTTPQNVKNIRDAILYFFMGCLTFASLFAPKLNLSGNDYAMWIGFIMLTVKSGAKFFGVNDDEAVQNAKDAVDEAKDTLTENKNS